MLELNRDDVIAVRASREGFERILAGKLTSEPATRAEIEEHLDESDGAAIISIDADVWWELDGGEINRIGHKLQDRLPYRPRQGEPLKEAPQCGLGCRDDGSVYLIIPWPVYHGSRLAYYGPDPMGTVVEMETGDLINPEALLPDDYDSAP